MQVLIFAQPSVTCGHAGIRQLNYRQATAQANRARGRDGTGSGFLTRDPTRPDLAAFDPVTRPGRSAF